MPRNPKLFTTGTLVELTCRTEEGLPFAPNKLIKILVENVLARAQTMYPIKIVSYVVMPNHIHILVVVQDPRNVPRFVEYFKRESAYFVNSLLGRIKHTVWCDGYDSPVIIDPETALNRLSHTILNPLAAKLIKNVANYPLSSSYWVDAKSASSEIQVRRIPRNKVPRLPRREMTLKDIDKAISKLEYRGAETFTLKIEPNAWMDCFVETMTRDPLELAELLDSRLALDSVQMIKEKDEQFPTLEQLQTENIRKEYHPTKFGKRMICIGKDKKTRLVYLKWYYEYCKSLPSYFKNRGDIVHRTHYPPGFFAPGGFLSANILRECTPFNSIA